MASSPRIPKVKYVKVDQFKYIPELHHDHVPERLRIEIHNASCPLINALRAIILSSLPVKYMYFDPININSDQLVLVPDLQLSIMYIPIDQRIPVNTTLFIDIKPSMSTQRVSSKDIRGWKNGIVANNPRHLILHISKSKYFKLSGIKIGERNGYCPSTAESSMHVIPALSLVTNTVYEILDYVRISVLEHGYVTEYFTDADSTISQQPDTLYCKSDDIDNARKYFWVQNKSNESNTNVSDEYFTDIVDIKTRKLYHATEIYPTQILLGFTTHGTMSAIDILKLACQYIINTINTTYFTIDDYQENEHARVYKAILFDIVEPQISHALLDVMRYIAPKHYIALSYIGISQTKVVIKSDYPDLTQLLTKSKYDIELFYKSILKEIK